MEEHKYFFSYAHSLINGHGFGSRTMVFDKPFDVDRDYQEIIESIMNDNPDYTGAVIINFIKLSP